MIFTYPTKEQINKLIDDGYKKEVFFFRTGGGEDEDNIDIYVNEEKDIAVTWDVWKGRFVQRKYSEINYVNGFRLDDADYFPTFDVQ